MVFSFGRFFGFASQSKLDGLLKQQNLTLETILDEEDILQELKNQSATKFANFVITHPVEFQKMITYIVDEVQELQDRNKQIKYPFLVSEILGSENEKLINFFFEKAEETSQEELQNPLEDQETQNEYDDSIRATLLSRLLALLENDVIVVTQAGYFSKAIQAIIRKRGFDFWEHIRHNPDILAHLMKHLSIRHISEIFEKMIILETNQPSLQQFEYTAERTDLLKRVMNYLLAKKHSTVIVQNICESLIEILHVAQQLLETNENIKEVLQLLCKPSFFIKLAEETNSSYVYQVLIAQLEFINSLSNTRQIDYLDLYQPILELMPKLIAYKDTSRVPFRSSANMEIRPIGDAKLQQIQFVLELLKIPQLQGKFVGSIFQELLELIVQYPNNNLLLLLFEKIVNVICESNNDEQIMQLFECSTFIEWLIKVNTVETRKQKLGYLGVVTRMTNYVNGIKCFSRIIQTSIEKCEGWDEYIKSIAEVNRIQQSWLLGINPRQREQVSVDSLSPPMLEPLVNYTYQPPTQIRKCESSDNNELKPKGEDISDIQLEDEDLEFHVNEKEKQNQQQDDNREWIEFTPTVFWKIEIDKENEERILNEYD